MAEIVLGILGLLTQPGEYLVNLIKKQVNYMCCYSCNVRELGVEVSTLEIDKKSVNEKIERARIDWGVIRPTAEVEAWLSEVDKIEKENSRIRVAAAEVQKSCLSSWCPFLHYSLSREAQKATEASAELRNKPATFKEVAYPVNAADLPLIPGASERFESRESLEKEIMDALKKNDVYLIGIHGMPGVGKTTMVKSIAERVREKIADSGSAFERVVMAVVSQQPDPSKIQEEIADGIGLKFQETTPIERAKRIHASLKSVKSILIILDDVWEVLDLEEIGIPSQSTHPECKLILTSREQEALNLTPNAKTFELKVLSPQESWILFRKYAGNSIDSPDLNEVARDVLEECKGLPLAIETVGRALINKGKGSWEDARSRLQQPVPGNIPKELKGVHRLLLLSFERLESEEDRYLFLLCCSFPEDSVISLEVLVRYGMGLGIFKGIKNLAEARNRVESIVNDLIFRSLLIKTSDKWGDLCVKMHDVIRDMGIWIAPEWKHVFMISHGREEWPTEEEWPNKDYNGISLTFSESDIDVPECIDYPKSELLRIGGNHVYLKIPDNFFTGMKSLKVLEASHIKSLPLSINFLNNLRTLHLSECKRGKISVIGELINLEILCLNKCGSIELLPKEIGELKKLKKLDVIECGNLRRIAFGVISRLVRLEELTIVRSFREWEAEENINASLVELDCLSHLTTLRIEISDPNAIPKRIPHWAHKVQKYSVSVGGKDPKITDLLLRFQKFILLGDEVVTPLGDWFYDHLVRDAQCLDLKGPSCTNVVNRLIASGYQNLTRFNLCNLIDATVEGRENAAHNNLNYLCDAFVEGRENSAIFPVLKTLDIEGSCSLKEISNGLPPPGSFKALEEIRLQNLSGFIHLWTFSSEELYLSNLKLVSIRGCTSMLYLFPQSIAESLLQLEKLQVTNCPEMKEIFKKEEGEIDTMINKIKFPKLYELSLGDLPTLCSFGKGVDGIEVPVLSHLRINFSTNMREDDPVQKQFLFNQQVVDNSLQLHLLVTPLSLFNLSNLQTLGVTGLYNFKSLFSPSVLSGFPNLKELWVTSCSKLEEVIGKEENVVGEAKTKTVVFPQLWRLKLTNLPKLLAFSHGMGDLEFPLLETVWIENCPMMETFFHSIGNIELPSLQNLWMTDCQMMGPFVKPLSTMPVPEHVNQSFFSEEVAGNNLQLPTLVTPLNLSGLQELRVEGVHNVKSLLSPLALGSFQNLKKLRIKNCRKLEEVIGKEENVVGETKTKIVVFSQLRGLGLTNLPKLLAFSHGIGDLEFPLLERVWIKNCPMMETFVKPLSNVSISEHVNQSLFSKKVSFCQLERLAIMSCDRITNLFSHPICNGFTNIQSLSLINCKKLQVIVKEDQEGLINIKETLFPQLRELELVMLPRIYRFCHMKNDIELPSLEDVKIDDCPMLETFSLGSLHLPSFKILRGLLDIDFAARFFFNKEKSSHGIHLENDCVTISARDLSINVEGSYLDWVLSPDSSGSFFAAAELWKSYDSKLLEIKGQLEMVQLRPGVAYEIIFIILLPDERGPESFLFELTLPGGRSAQNQREISDEKPRGECVEILVGEFRTKADQIGELKFSLSLHGENFDGALLIKGVKIQLKA